MAAQALPCGKFDATRLERAAEILATGDLWKLPAPTPLIAAVADGQFHFASAVTTPSAKNNVVHGQILRVNGAWQTKPLVILVHGWNAELHYLYVLPRVARTLVRRGFNAALLELPYHLQRRPARDSAVRDFISDDLHSMLMATRQSLADIDALVRWARAQGCHAVAVWGFSLGAWLAGLYLCRSSLASHAVLTTPIIDLAQAVRELSFCHPIRAAIGERSIDLSPLNLTAHRPKIPAESICACQCEYDQFVPGESYDQLFASWGNLARLRLPQSHISVLLSRSATNATIDWLARQTGRVTAASTPELRAAPAAQA